MANACHNQLKLAVTGQGKQIIESYLKFDVDDSSNVEVDDSSNVEVTTAQAGIGLFTQLLMCNSTFNCTLLSEAIKNDKLSDWYRENFGCRHDLEDANYTVEQLEDDVYELKFIYDTAWSPHEPAVDIIYHSVDFILGVELLYYETGEGYFGQATRGLLGQDDFDDSIIGNEQLFDELFGQGMYKELGFKAVEEELGGDQ